MSPFDELQNGITDVLLGASIAALQRAEGDMKARIHQRGESTNEGRLVTRATPSIGRYSVPHAKKRKSLNRKTSMKDLEIFGDFRNAYGVGTNQGIPVMGFFIDKARLIASGQTDQTGQTIFEQSTREREDMLEIFIARLNRGLANLVS